MSAESGLRSSGCVPHEDGQLSSGRAWQLCHVPVQLLQGLGKARIVCVLCERSGRSGSSGEASKPPLRV